jgi:hypothetical protein
MSIRDRPFVYHFSVNKGASPISRRGRVWSLHKLTLNTFQAYQITTVALNGTSSKIWRKIQSRGGSGRDLAEPATINPDTKSESWAAGALNHVPITRYLMISDA